MPGSTAARAPDLAAKAQKASLLSEMIVDQL